MLISMKPDPAPIPRRKKPLICESVYAETEDARHASEVQMVVEMGSKEQRREYLSGVETKRGKAAADRLKADILKGWRKDGK